MKKLLIILSVIITGSLYAQEVSNYSRLISFSPQYLINNGIRLDYERKISSNKWLVVAPQLYLAEKKSRSAEDNVGRDDFNLMAGAGLSLALKNYALKDDNFGAYIGYGLYYNYFYTEYFEDTDNEEEIKANIHKTGFDIILGYQLVVYNIATLDIYTGFGARKSFIDNGEYSNDKFNGFPVGFNMTGNILLLGIKIGILY